MANLIVRQENESFLLFSLSLFFRMYSSVSKATDQTLLLYLLKSNV